MENRCNGDAGGFRPAELLPAKLTLSSVLKKSCLGRKSLPNSDQNGHPDRPSKANWRKVFANGEIPGAALKLLVEDRHRLPVQHSATSEGEYFSLVR